jgi:hypothetical protein
MRIDFLAMRIVRDDRLTSAHALAALPTARLCIKDALCCHSPYSYSNMNMYLCNVCEHGFLVILSGNPLVLRFKVQTKRSDTSRYDLS